jgi:hypothetical protein
MCENVNINVSETNETINIVSSEIQEVIDINVFETTEDVTLNITEEIIQVNINKVTAAEQIQSDWAQTDNEALDFIKNKPTIPTNTSDLINDGEDGVHPFITLEDIPVVTGFVPYTGATEDVNLGEFGLLTGNVEFDNTPTNVPTTAGAMYWNDADGTADLILKGGNVKLQVGQESVIRVVNKTATNINLLEANYQAVRVTGAQGQRLKVDLAQATTDNLSAETIGLVTETINNNQEGFITTSGIVRGINTTGSLQGETWADGDILYLSPTTAGNATKVKPTAPNHLVILGYVIHAHINQGSIFIKVDNGYELDELHNVKITSAANNNVLAYTSATDIWENKTVETALGYTPQQQLISGTNIKTINGASVLGSGDLVVGGSTSLAIGTTPITSGTIGRVLFQGTGDVLQQSANFFWDNTNGRLGVGTATPANSLDILGNVRISNQTLVGNNGGQISLKATDGNPAVIGIQGNYFQALGFWGMNRFTNSSTPDFRILGTGDVNVVTNLLINTTTNAGFKLDVNGTARVVGEGLISGLTIGKGSGAGNAENTSLGFRALSTNSTGARNTAVGYDSLFSNSTGTDITVVGRYTGRLNTGSFVTAIGGEAVGGNVTSSGAYNTGVGYQAIKGGTGAQNTAIGALALAANTTGGDNTAMGMQSLNTNISGSRNVAIGYQSLFNNTASNNTALGHRTAFNLTTGDFNITIGSFVNPASNTAIGQLNIGNVLYGVNLYQNTSMSSTPTTNGAISIGVTAPAASAVLDVTSTTKGFLPPRMTLAQRNAITTPAAGLVVYDTTLNKLCLYTTTWETITSL